MDLILDKELWRAYQDQFVAPFMGTAWEWAGQNIELTKALSEKMFGKYSIVLTPFLKAIYEDFLDPLCRQINAVSCVQTGRSLCLQICLLYMIANAPQSTLMIASSGDQQDAFVKGKIQPLINCCPVVSDLLSAKNAVTLKGIQLPDDIHVTFNGTSPKLLAGLTVSLLLLDECWLYPAGTIALAKTRIKSNEDTAKTFICSQHGKAGDDLDKEFNSGQIWEWGWTCPACNNLQPYYWNERKPESTKENPVYAGIQWDRILKPDGSNDLEAMAQTARLQCFHCSHSIAGTDEEARRTISDSGEYVLTKDGDGSIRSRTWSRFAFIRTNFAKEVLTYLKIEEQHGLTGYSDLLNKFWQEVLGKVYPKKAPLTLSVLNTETYDPQGKWADERYRWLSVDYQEHLHTLFWLIRAASKTGESRLIDLGYCHDWKEIQQLAIQNKIEPYNVLVDSGYDSATVYSLSVRMGKWVQVGNRRVWAGWTCMNGDGLDDFKGKDGIRRPYRESLAETNLKNDPLFRGKPARLISWAATPFKTILHHLKDGKGIKWISNIQDEKKRALYQRHLSCEQLEDVRNSKTQTMEKRYVEKHQDSHWMDCECQVLVAMWLKNLLGNYADISIEEEKKDGEIVSV